MPREPMPPTADNPRGYWESRRIARFNNRLLESAGTRWSDPAAISDSWFDEPARAIEATEAASLLTEEFPPQGPLICKDPRICRLLPLWRRGFLLAGITHEALLVLRDPRDVAASLASRAADPAFQPASVPSPAASLVLWLRYVLEAERYSRDLGRHSLDYAAVLADWRATLDSVFAAGLLPRPDHSTAAEIDAFLDPALRHHGNAGEAARLVSGPAADLCLEVRDTVHFAAAGCGTAVARCDQIRAALDALLAEACSRFGPRDPRAVVDPVADAVLAGLCTPQRVPPRTRPRARRALLVSGVPQSIGHIYRIEHVAEALRAHGWRAEWRALDDPKAIEAIGEADVVTVFRTPWGDPLAAIHSRCRAYSVPLVFDVDDLLFDPQVTAAGCIALTDGHDLDERTRWINRSEAFRRAVAAADTAILTTVPLAEAARPLCPHVAVLPNALSREMEAAAKAARLAAPSGSTEGRPRLLFASGTPTHHRDFAVAAEAIASLFARRPEPLLVVVGHLRIADYASLAPFRARIECRPRVPFDALFLEIVRGDINLCPLELGNPFCESKSAVRWLAAAVAGVPSVASPTVPLRDVIRHGETGLLAATAAEWAAALESLVDDASARGRMGEAARREALARFGFDTWSIQVASIYGEIVDRGPVPRPSPAPTACTREAHDG